MQDNENIFMQKKADRMPTPISSREKDAVTEILWTGGWDSTYRMVELSRKNVTVRPIYIADPNRSSRPYEIRAMETITELLRKKEGTKAAILPFLQVPLDSIPKNAEITKAYNLFKKEAGMGIQHEWTARLAMQHPGIEMCIEKAGGGIPLFETQLKTTENC